MSEPQMKLCNCRASKGIVGIPLQSTFTFVLYYFYSYIIMKHVVKNMYNIDRDRVNCAVAFTRHS